MLERHIARTAELYLVLAVLFLVASLGTFAVELRDLELVRGRGASSRLQRLDSPHRLVLRPAGGLLLDGEEVDAAELVERLEPNRPVAVFAQFEDDLRAVLGDLYAARAEVLLGVDRRDSEPDPR